MASTFTTFLGLEKHEDRSVGWDLGPNWDIIDQALSGNSAQLVNESGTDMFAFEPVGFSTVTDNVFVGAQLGTTLASGILLEDAAVDAAGQILTRGFVENPDWAWNLGATIYLGSASINPGVGTFVERPVGSDAGVHLAEGTPDEVLHFQPVGIAVSPTRVWFDFNPLRPSLPYSVAASGYIVSAGAAAASATVVTGPGMQHVLTTTGATDIIYSFAIPPWFKAMPNVQSVWGFRIWYALGSGTIDVTQVYDGNNHAGDPAVGTAASTSWASFDVDFDKFYTASGSWAPSAGKQVLVKVSCSATAAVLELAPRLRFEPLAAMSG